MNRNPNSFAAIFNRPSASFPVAMSVVALTMVLGHIAFFGAAREAGKGTAAHIWQLLMVGQIPLLAFFAFRWIPRAPKQAAAVLALQLAAALSSLALVYFLKL